MEDDKISVAKEPMTFYGNNHTYGDYLKWEFDEMVELIRGRVFRMSPAPSSDHQRISLNLTKLMLNTFDKNACELFVAPFDVILPIENKKKKDSNTVVQPDLCIICDPIKVKKAGCFGAPDLVIEIISPHTSKKDLDHKYSVYEESGIREYWVVFPGDALVFNYVLNNSKYEKQKVYTRGDTMTSTIFPTIQIKLQDVFPKEEY